MIKKLSAVALLALAAAPASAQYMYLDTNGNGIHDADDRLNGNGTATTVDVWISTDKNRDGTPAAPDISGEPLDLCAYVVNLEASGGTVTYSDFVNQQPTMSIHFLTWNPDGVHFKDGYGGQTYLPPGTYRLATLTIAVATGMPTVDIVDCVQGSTDFTGFGTHCWGASYDNHYKLDGPTTLEVQGVPGDFHDADGVAAAAFVPPPSPSPTPSPSSGPATSDGESGPKCSASIAGASILWMAVATLAGFGIRR